MFNVYAFCLVSLRAAGESTRMVKLVLEKVRNGKQAARRVQCAAVRCVSRPRRRRRRRRGNVLREETRCCRCRRCNLASRPTSAIVRAENASPSSLSRPPLHQQRRKLKVRTDVDRTSKIIAGGGKKVRTSCAERNYPHYHLGDLSAHYRISETRCRSFQAGLSKYLSPTIRRLGTI